MALFDYGNTRLRARLSEALNEETLESFCNLSSLDSYISALTKTPYQQSIEAALTLAFGYRCIIETKRLELLNLANDLNRFYEDEAHRMVTTIFWHEDLHNLKSILRGINHQVPMEMVAESLTPLGTIPYQTLEDIARSKNLDGVINQMIIHNIGASQALLALRSSKEELDSVKMELAIEKWYFDLLMLPSRGGRNDVRLLKEYIAYEADIVNLNTILRMVAENGTHYESQTNSEILIIHSGSIPEKTWFNLARESQIDDVIIGLRDSRYHQWLESAKSQYQKTNRLSEFESCLRREMLKWQAGLPRKHPFGIGVPLGYVAIKKNELRNLVWIAKGIQSGFEPQYIKANLERIS